MSKPPSPPFFAGVVECIKQTEKAILVKSPRREEWIPQSAVHDDSEVWKLGDNGRLVVFEWFASKQGWVDGKASLPLSQSKCRSCGEPIEWKKTEAGKNTPVNLDQSSHWATCPSVDQHRKRGA